MSKIATKRAVTGLKWMGVMTLLLMAVAVWPMLQLDSLSRWSIAAGWLLCLLVSFSGWVAIAWASDYDQSKVMAVVIGGMLARLAVIGTILALVVAFELVDPRTFVVGLMIPYVAYQAVEIILIPRVMKNPAS